MTTSPARTHTPDQITYGEDGVSVTRTVKLKRACNGCGDLLGDVDNRDVDDHGNLTDVRAECPYCAPVVDWERAGARAWNLTPRNITTVDDVVDRDGIYAKGYWETVDGELKVTGLRIGHDETRIVAKYGDWIIRHRDGTWAVHPRPAA